MVYFLRIAGLCGLLLLSVFYLQDAQAQSEDQYAVRAVIDQLFDGMRAGDSTMVRATFHPDAVLGSTRDGQGNSRYQSGTPADRFVAAVGRPHDQVWDEKIWDVEIHVDDNLAVAWMQYAFFLGETLSHCGVNAFQFFRSEDGWKITNLIDTRRRQGCNVPAGL